MHVRRAPLWDREISRTSFQVIWNFLLWRHWRIANEWFDGSRVVLLGWKLDAQALYSRKLPSGWHRSGRAQRCCPTDTQRTWSRSTLSYISLTIAVIIFVLLWHRYLTRRLFVAFFPLTVQIKLPSSISRALSTRHELLGSSFELWNRSKMDLTRSNSTLDRCYRRPNQALKRIWICNILFLSLWCLLA